MSNVARKRWPTTASGSCRMGCPIVQHLSPKSRSSTPHTSMSAIEAPQFVVQLPADRQGAADSGRATRRTSAAPAAGFNSSSGSQPQSKVSKRKPVSVADLPGGVLPTLGVQGGHGRRDHRLAFELLHVLHQAQEGPLRGWQWPSRKTSTLPWRFAPQGAWWAKPRDAFYADHADLREARPVSSTESSQEASSATISS